MLRTFLISILLIAHAFCFAQSETDGSVPALQNAATPETIPEQQLMEQSEQITPAPIENGTTDIEAQPDTSTIRSIQLPRYATRPYMFTLWSPTSPFGWGTPWDIHEGFNAQIGLGVMVGFGKNNPFRGASLYQDLSLLYAKPIDNHWTLALGGTLSHFMLYGKSTFAGNIFALANYKIDDHWSASIYASYNHMPQGTAFLYGIHTPETMYFNENFARIGGEVTYRFNNNISVSVGLSTGIQTDTPRPWLPQHPTDLRPQAHPQHR